MPLPDPATLTARLVRCIGIYETNRGGNDPAPRESALKTFAGLPASMATVEQATMPYALDALSRDAGLRARAVPKLSEAEIAQAIACCQAVQTLLRRVEAASAAGMGADAFSVAEPKAIEAARLGPADLVLMFRSVPLRAKVNALAAEVAAGRLTFERALAAIPAAERLGLDDASLRSYLRTPGFWGEHRAAWQRKAVRALPGEIGARVEAVAVSEKGCALAVVVVRRGVDAALAAVPRQPPEALVRDVAQMNNPKEDGYGSKVQAIYRRLFPGDLTP